MHGATGRVGGGADEASGFRGDDHGFVLIRPEVAVNVGNSL